MKKILKRVAAYVIDFMVLMIVASLISNITFINPQVKNYNKYYNELTEVTKEYSSFTKDLKEYYDNGLEQSNYEKLIDDHESYEKTVYSYYEDGILEKEEYDDLLKEVEKDYQEQYKELYYKIEKNSTISYITYIVFTILYFGLFNLITDGQTLGKKIFRLKIVKRDGTKSNIINYLLRSILLYNTIYYLIAVISVYLLNQDSYYTLTSIVYQIQYYIQLIIMLMIVMRTDGVGLHDLLGNTKVIALDKDGKIIEEEQIIKKDYKIIEKNKKSKKKSKVIEAKTSEEEK